MRRRLVRNGFLFIALLSLAAGFVATRPTATAQDGLENPVFRVKVDLVVLNVAGNGPPGPLHPEVESEGFPGV